MGWIASFSAEGKLLNLGSLFIISATTDSFGISLSKFLLTRRGKRLGMLEADKPKASDYKLIYCIAFDLSIGGGKWMNTPPSLEGTALDKEKG